VAVLLPTCFDIGTGALLLTRTALGQFTNLEEPVKTVSLRETYQPNKNDHQVYKRYYQIFESLSHKLNDEFASIARLQNS
jgi:gluconokinase